MTNKVIFRESEYSEFDCLYDDDFIKGKGGDGYENAILYVIAGSDYAVTNKQEWERLCKLVDDIATDFYDLLHNNGYYFRTFKEICHYYDVKYSPVMVHKLKAFAESYDDRSFDDIAAFLTITTGKEWDTYQVCGYCQGDYATGIYCKDHWDAESLELYVSAAAGTVSEFCRIDGELQLVDPEFDGIVEPPVGLRCREGENVVANGDLQDQILVVPVKTCDERAVGVIRDVIRMAGHCVIDVDGRQFVGRTGGGDGRRSRRQKFFWLHIDTVRPFVQDGEGASFR